jgi:hypothetical protein
VNRPWAGKTIALQKDGSACGQLALFHTQ